MSKTSAIQFITLDKERELFDASKQGTPQLSIYSAKLLVMYFEIM